MIYYRAMKYGERKPISKAMRQKVYDKYDGHCAYCGRKIKMREMQVDHIIPIAYSYYGPREQVEKVIKSASPDRTRRISQNRCE